MFSFVTGSKRPGVTPCSFCVAFASFLFFGRNVTGKPSGEVLSFSVEAREETQ